MVHEPDHVDFSPGCGGGKNPAIDTVTDVETPFRFGSVLLGMPYDFAVTPLYLQEWLCSACWSACMRPILQHPCAAVVFHPLLGSCFLSIR